MSFETATEHTSVDDAYIGKLAHAVCQRKMEAPAVFLLETMKPLSGLLLASTQVSAPVLYALFGREPIERLLRLLESRADIERLIQSIEGYSSPEERA